jgi:hypothetical protein
VPRAEAGADAARAARAAGPADRPSGAGATDRAAGAGRSAAAGADRPSAGDDRELRLAAILFTVVVLLHNGDHLRRGGDSVGTDVFWLGSAAIVVEVLLVGLVFLRHRLAAPLAAVAGVLLAAGYLTVHFTPGRSWISDSFVDGGASPLSLAAGGLEVLAALVLALAGGRHWRRQGLAPSTAGAGTGSIAHPAVVAMVAGNLIVFAGSVLTR